MIFQFSARGQDNEVLIKGTVVDVDDEGPLPGVNIMEEGTSNGTTTDFDGDFEFTVQEDATIVFSSMGYATQKIDVDGETEFNVALEISGDELDEVIVTGYTNQVKREVTSSVSNIKGEDLQDVTTPDVGGMLQGKAAGVDVVNTEGKPGSKPTINIRGLSSINGSTNPLWVVDGAILHDAPDLNPNEVESMSVLKDASATALYGSRGANGVIVVTTKSGKKGETTVSVNSKLGFSKFSFGNFGIMNSQELYDYYQEFSNPDRIPSEINEELLDTDFDWVKNGTQSGLTQDHNVSLSGGSEKTKTFFSLGYYNEEGSLKGYDYNKLSTRLNLDYEVNDKLTLKPKVGINYSYNKDQQHSIYVMNTNMPWDHPYDDEGNLVNPQEPGVDWIGRDEENYLHDLQWNYSKGKTLKMNTNFDFEYKITPKLRFQSTNNFTLYYNRGKSYTDPRSNGGKADKGYIGDTNVERITKFTNQMLKYSNTFGDHNLSVIGAFEYNDYNYESSGATGKGIVAGSSILDVTASPEDVSGTRNQYAVQSLLSNVDYSFDDRYMAQFSIRNDGASNFGKDHKYGTFFSFSGGWNIHNEAFYKSEIVDQLKLRASYGSVGNRPDDLYPQYSKLALNESYSGNPSAIPSQLGNQNLTWEKSFQSNIAVDARLFERFNFTVEYYDKNTSELLYNVSLPAVTGYTGVWRNVGAVRNKGFEGNIDANIFDQDNAFQWDVQLNIGANTNKVTELYEGQEIDRGDKISREGKDFNSWYMRKWLGVDSENGKPLWEVVDKETGETSETSDYNKATKQIVGTSSPDLYGGINSTMSYKNFTLGMNFSYVTGGQVLNLSRQLYDADGAYPTYNQQKLKGSWNRWKEPGDDATHPELVYGGNNNSNKPSSRYLETATYLRLRNLRFGYSFSEKLLEPLNIKSAELYFSGDNIFTVTGFSGTDPEVGNDGTFDNAYPLPKRFMFGVNLSF